MAAPRVTAETVYNAAEELVEQGQHPSAATVRDYLGSGSYTTISKYLQLWRADQEQAITDIDLPESVETLYRKAAVASYQAGRQQAGDEVAAIKETLAQERARHAQDITERNREIERLETLVDELEALKSRESEWIAKLEKAAESVAYCKNVTLQNDTLTAKVKDLETENRQLNRQIGKLEARQEPKATKPKPKTKKLI